MSSFFKIWASLSQPFWKLLKLLYRYFMVDTIWLKHYRLVIHDLFIAFHSSFERNHAIVLAMIDEDWYFSMVPELKRFK